MTSSQTNNTTENNKYFLNVKCSKCGKHNSEIEQLFEKLNTELTNLYHQLDTHEVWGIGGDEVCDNCEELVKKKITKLKEKYMNKKQSLEEHEDNCKIC